MSRGAFHTLSYENQIGYMPDAINRTMPNPNHVRVLWSNNVPALEIKEELIIVCGGRVGSKLVAGGVGMGELRGIIN